MLSQMVLDECGSLQREGVRVFDILRNALRSLETDQFTDRRPPLRLVAAPPPVYGKFADAAGGTSPRELGVCPAVTRAC